MYILILIYVIFYKNKCYGYFIYKCWDERRPEIFGRFLVYAWFLQINMHLRFHSSWFLLIQIHPHLAQFPPVSGIQIQIYYITFM